MGKLIGSVVLLLIWVTSHGQAKYYHDCSVDSTHIHFSTSPHIPITTNTPTQISGGIGDSFDIILTPTECHREVLFVIDFQSYNIPDRITIHEDGVETLNTGWIGNPLYNPVGETVIRGYVEFVDGVQVITSGNTIPSDFHDGFLFNVSSGVWGLTRITMTSDASEIIIRTHSHPESVSAISTYVHCTEAFGEHITTYESVFVCDEPEQSQVIVDDGDCRTTTVIDSIWGGDDIFMDTICVEKNTWLSFDPKYDELEWEPWVDTDIYVTETFDFIGMALSENGCEFEHMTHIIVLDYGVYFPNIFSPNGDGNNDTFYGTTTAGATIINIMIYDRWGNLIYEGTEWDGYQYQNGVYVYLAEVEYKTRINREFIAGSVTILK